MLATSLHYLFSLFIQKFTDKIVHFCKVKKLNAHYNYQMCAVTFGKLRLRLAGQPASESVNPCQPVGLARKSRQLLFFFFFLISR